MTNVKQEVSAGLTEQHRWHAAHVSSNRHGQAEANFQTLLESAPDAIVIIDGAGRIAIANHQAERLFGYRRDELLGQPIELLIPTTCPPARSPCRCSRAIGPSACCC